MKQPKVNAINLIIDVGNSRIKYAFFKENVFLDGGIGISELPKKITTYHTTGEVFNVLLSGTGAIPDEFQRYLQTVAYSFYKATSTMPLPIRLGYETPASLGIDRVAACIGGAYLFPQSDILIVDSGTAVTFDFLQRDGLFLGGNISPGIKMRLRALHEFTNNLPAIECSSAFKQIGQNTRDAILSGVMNGVLFEIQTYIDRFKEKYPEAIIILTGGDVVFLKDTLKRDIYFEEKLVLIGLNQLLEYQLHLK